MSGGRFMWRGVAGVCAAEFVLGMLFAFGGGAVRFIALAVAAPAVFPLFHDIACHYVLRTGHCVYRLVDRDGTTLYVGSTNDRIRRLAEHTDGTGAPWRQRIYAMRIHRNLRTQRQARRVERRLIRCMRYAVEREWAVPIYNGTWNQATPGWVERAVTWAWTWAYVGQAKVFADCGWTWPSHTHGTWIVARQRRRGVDDDDWFDTPTPAGPDPGDGPLTATYDRDAPTGPTPNFTLIALGPVRDASRDAAPLRSRGASPGAPDRDRDASRNPAWGPSTGTGGGTEGDDGRGGDDGPDDEPEPANETAEERRKRLDRNRARRYRARKASAS